MRLHWRRLLAGGLMLLGLVVQLFVLAMVYELAELSIMLMEVWAELARKHLEITLS